MDGSAYNMDRFTAEHLLNIKQELEFDQMAFRNKKVQSLEKAKTKEQVLYKNVSAVRDQIDSQHLWAGKKIKKMYGVTKMHFA